jgi:TetR/AcrR family transcriptional repressor of nem operon
VTRPSDTRERLFKAAHDLVSTRGYAAVSVDDMCVRAGVKKGSFYHFFASKGALVAAAVEEHWVQRAAQMDRIFSPSRPPLERLQLYFDDLCQTQVEHKREHGYALGCPLLSIGCEVAEQEPQLAVATQRVLERLLLYFESALRDAQAQGAIEARAEDVPELARALFSYVEGALAQVRLRNDPELLRGLAAGALRFLSVEPSPR